MLEVNNLTKKFGENAAVNNVHFKVEEGTILGILGRNGAGKSTIFRIILSIIEQDCGTVIYNNSSINNSVSDTIGYLPEEGSLMLSYTVIEQCLYYGTLKSLNENFIKKEVIRWLKRFNILQYMNTKLKDLSKGNRQKIQFIISVLHNPKLIILDEPFSGLDPISLEELKQVVLELKQQGKNIIFSSHRMDHVQMLCDDILILEKGNQVIYGNLNDIINSYSIKNIIVKADISDEIIKRLKSIEKVVSVKKIDKEKFNIKLESIESLNKIMEILKDINIVDFSVNSVNLNDIFLDKVGKYYEDE